MEKEIIKRGEYKKVLKLLTTKYESASAICSRANGKPYKNYLSYVRNLEILCNLGLVEKMELEGKKNKLVYYRKVIKK